MYKTTSYFLALVCVLIFTGCFNRNIENSTKYNQSANFLNDINLYTSEKMNFDEFLGAEQLSLISTKIGLHPDSLQTEMEIRIILNNSSARFFDYRLDSISKMHDDDFSIRLNKKNEYWYCYGSKDYESSYTFTDSTLTFQTIQAVDSTIVSDEIKYQISNMTKSKENECEIQLTRIK